MANSTYNFDGFSVPPFWQGGPSPSGYYSFPGKKSASAGQPKTHSQVPITTGTSVFSIKYKDGVIIAADTMGSYGSLARFPDLKRVFAVNRTTIVGFTGDIADFQFIQEQIERKQREEDAAGGGITMKPKALHCWLTRVLYNRRSKFDPLWLTLIVGGDQDGETFLGGVDSIGTAWKENFIATGIGAEFVPAVVYDELEAKGGTEKLTFEEAKELIKKMIRVCYLRDCRATAKFYLAYTDKDGTQEEGPFIIDSNWGIANYVQGYE